MCFLLFPIFLRHVLCLQKTSVSRLFQTSSPQDLQRRRIEIALPAVGNIGRSLILSRNSQVFCPNLISPVQPRLLRLIHTGKSFLSVRTVRFQFCHGHPAVLLCKPAGNGYIYPALCDFFLIGCHFYLDLQFLYLASALRFDGSDGRPGICRSNGNLHSAAYYISVFGMGRRPDLCDSFSESLISAVFLRFQNIRFPSDRLCMPFHALYLPGQLLTDKTCLKDFSHKERLLLQIKLCLCR